MNSNTNSASKGLAKKVFISGKIYDTNVLTEKQIETAVQADLDSLIGKDKVIFNISITQDRINLIFRRNVDYGRADCNTLILDADAYMICGIGLNGFKPPHMWLEPPMNCTYRFEQNEFVRCYKENALELGGDKVNRAKLEIRNDSLIFRLK